MSWILVDAKFAIEKIDLQKLFLQKINSIFCLFNNFSLLWKKEIHLLHLTVYI